MRGCVLDSIGKFRTAGAAGRRCGDSGTGWAFNRCPWRRRRGGNSHAPSGRKDRHQNENAYATVHEPSFSRKNDSFRFRLILSFRAPHSGSVRCREEWAIGSRHLDTQWPGPSTMAPVWALQPETACKPSGGWDLLSCECWPQLVHPRAYNRKKEYFAICNLFINAPGLRVYSHCCLYPAHTRVRRYDPNRPALSSCICFWTNRAAGM